MAKKTSKGTSTKKTAQSATNDLPVWTVLVFMVGDAELQPSLERDLLELERAGSSKLVGVIAAVQRTARSNTDWLQIAPRTEDGDRQRSEKVGGSDSGDLNARFDEFLRFVARERPSRHYFLVFWGHASGLGFGRLAPGSREDLIRLTELVTSLQCFREARGGARKLDVLGFCACALSKAEFAIELRNEVNFLVSSQVGISTLMTWPFDRILQRMLTSPSVQPGTLAAQVVHSFEESYEPPPVALTALHLEQSDQLADHVDGVARSILKALNKSGDSGTLNNLCVLSAFQKAVEAYPYELETLVDFFDFCQKLIEEEELDEPVRRKARRVVDGGVRSFVVSNARSGPKLGALNGLSILAPDFKDPNWTANWSETNAWLWQKTQWATMAKQVHAFAAANRDFILS